MFKQIQVDVTLLLQNGTVHFWSGTGIMTLRDLPSHTRQYVIRREFSTAKVKRLSVMILLIFHPPPHTHNLR